MRTRFWKVAVFSTLFVMIIATLLGNAGQVRPTHAADVLRDYAAARNFRIGAAASIDWWDNKTQSDPTYGDILKREFNMTVCENCMKMQFLQPERGVFDWRGADALMAYAEANGMTVRGHTLVWYDNFLPDWVKNGSWTRDSLLEVLRIHIQTVVTRYKGRIKYWDVVNEAIKDEWNGGNALRDDQSVWQRVIGSDHIRLAFEYAHAADPDAVLYYNDYDTEWMSNNKSTFQYNMIRDLKNAGVPIEGVGFQYHHSITYNANYDNLSQNFARYRDLGLEVQITEADIRICQTGGTVSSCNPTTSQLNQQADVYRNSLRACLDASNCTGYTLWGFTDKYTWVVPFWGPDAPLIMDTNFNKKAAWFALRDQLNSGGQPTFQPPTNTPNGNGGNGTPYTGTPYTIPGRIEVENYNNGGQGVAYNDTTSGNEGGNYRNDGVDLGGTNEAGYNSAVLGWTANGEWLKYTVNVTTSGTYTIEFRVASNISGSSYYLEVDGVNVTGTMNVASTGGWDTWRTDTKTNVNLSAGQRVMRLVVVSGGFNMGWFQMWTTSTTSPTNTPTGNGGNNGTPYTGSPISLPGRIEAENYNNGGQGVAYNDTDSSNNGGQYRSDGVDIENTNDAGGGRNVGWIQNGEWLKYTVNVGTAGNYKFDFRLASPNSGGTFYVEVDGNNVTGNVVLSSTGGWQSWVTYQNTGIYLSSGQHVIRVVVVTGNFNLNYIDVYQ
jgi:GH35 family endo-1,4-beta-xylanase